MTAELPQEQLNAVKKSFLNMLALFLGEEKIESRYLRCLLKWSFQLHVNPNDLKSLNLDIGSMKYERLDNKPEKLESIYHLVYMIYLDDVVEDVELEVAAYYAHSLGFSRNTVDELFRSIATADFDNSGHRDFHQEVMDFLRLHKA